MKKKKHHDDHFDLSAKESVWSIPPGERRDLIRSLLDPDWGPSAQTRILAKWKPVLQLTLRLESFLEEHKDCPPEELVDHRWGRILSNLEDALETFGQKVTLGSPQLQDAYGQLWDDVRHAYENLYDELQYKRKDLLPYRLKEHRHLVERSKQLTEDLKKYLKTKYRS